MNSDRDTRYRVGCPIRRSRDHRSLASPPGFSQRATSFIASQCQGIHQMPLLALDPRRFRKETPHKTAAHRGKTPPRQAASHEDTSRIHPSLAARAYPPRSHHNSLFTLQSTRALPGRPGNAIGFFSKRRSWKCPNRGGARWWRCQMVEVNGFEPMTSCLQSRRSPN